MSNSVISLAINEALKSKCIHKLGAVITKGKNKIICSGYNNKMRTSYLNEITCCQHAEMSACNVFINSIVRRNQPKVSWERF